MSTLSKQVLNELAAEEGCRNAAATSQPRSRSDSGNASVASNLSQRQGGEQPRFSHAPYGYHAVPARYRTMNGSNTGAATPPSDAVSSESTHRISSFKSTPPRSETGFINPFAPNGSGSDSSAASGYARSTPYVTPAAAVPAVHHQDQYNTPNADSGILFSDAIAPRVVTQVSGSTHSFSSFKQQLSPETVAKINRSGNSDSHSSNDSLAYKQQQQQGHPAAQGYHNPSSIVNTSVSNTSSSPASNHSISGNSHQSAQQNNSYPQTPANRPRTFTLRQQVADQAERDRQDQQEVVPAVSAVPVASLDSDVPSEAEATTTLSIPESTATAASAPFVSHAQRDFSDAGADASALAEQRSVATSGTPTPSVGESFSSSAPSPSGPHPSQHGLYSSVQPPLAPASLSQVRRMNSSLNTSQNHTRNPSTCSSSVPTTTLSTPNNGPTAVSTTASVGGDDGSSSKSKSNVGGSKKKKRGSSNRSSTNEDSSSTSTTPMTPEHPCFKAHIKLEHQGLAYFPFPSGGSLPKPAHWPEHCTIDAPVPGRPSYRAFIGQVRFETTAEQIAFIIEQVTGVVVSFVASHRNGCFVAHFASADDCSVAVQQHKRILFDLHGVWVAQSDEQMAAVQAAIKNKAVLHRHRLPRGCMVIEHFTSTRTSAGVPQELSPVVPSSPVLPVYQPQQQQQQHYPPHPVMHSTFRTHQRGGSSSNVQPPVQHLSPTAAVMTTTAQPSHPQYFHQPPPSSSTFSGHTAPQHDYSYSSQHHNASPSYYYAPQQQQQEGYSNFPHPNNGYSDDQQHLPHYYDSSNNILSFGPPGHDAHPNQKEGETERSFRHSSGNF